jgi:hypothetical protein
VPATTTMGAIGTHLASQADMLLKRKSNPSAPTAERERLLLNLSWAVGMVTELCGPSTTRQDGTPAAIPSSDGRQNQDGACK